jgi:hypothetical protein
MRKLLRYLREINSPDGYRHVRRGEAQVTYTHFGLWRRAWRETGQQHND